MIIWPSPVVGAGPVTASLDGIIFGAVDGHGTRLMLFDDDGWYGSAAVRRDGRAARPSANGVFTSPGYDDGLPIILSGVGYATNMAAGLHTVRDMRGAVSSDNKSAVLSWFDPDESVVLSALVERDGPWRVSWKSDRAFEWQVALFAPDPRRYAEPITLSTGLPGGGTGLSWPIGSFFNFGDPGSLGQVTVTNDGTAPTEPQFTVSGPLSVGFQITEAETSRRLRYESPVSADVAIDCGEGTATSGGQDREGLLTVDEFFSIPAGASRTYQFSTLGAESADSAARMSVTVSPAYH